MNDDLLIIGDKRWARALAYHARAKRRMRSLGYLLARAFDDVKARLWGER